jgi:WD40 repeat protein
MQPDTIVHNRYRLIYPVDERPASRTYRARDEQTGQLVLIGALPFVDDEMREGTTQLAQQLASLRHDFLLPLTDHFAEGQSYYLVCEDPGGQDLERTLRTRGAPLPEADVLTEARRFLDAADYFHQQRPPFFLGEPWPSDIWIGESGAWRLTPFTLARHVGHTSSSYRAPELDSDHAEPTASSDTYAISALLYYALTGWPPASAEQQEAGTPLNGPRTLNPELSALIEQVLLRGLQRKDVNRYQNAREMRLSLETVQVMAGRSLGLGPDVLTEVKPQQPAQHPPLTELPAAPSMPPAASEQPYPGGYPSTPTPVTAGAYPMPGQAQPYPGAYQEPTPKKRSFGIGCLIAIAITLVLMVLAACAVLAFLTNGFGLLSGASAPLAQVAPPVATSGAPSEPINEPTPDAAPTIASIELGPLAITLANADTITQTRQITSEVAGSVAYAPDGETLALSVSNNITLRTGSDLSRQSAPLTGHTGQVMALAWSPDSALLASGAVDDRVVRLWNPQTGKQVRTFEGHSDWIRSVAFSLDGDILASASTDQTIKLWDVQSGRLLRTLEGHTNWVNSVAFSPDGETLASSSRDGTVRVWDVATGEQQRDFSFETELNPATNELLWTTGVAFNRDGDTIAVGTLDGVVYLLDAKTGDVKRDLRGHTDVIVFRGLTFTPDGKTVLSASADSTIRAWNAETGAEEGVFEQHNLGVFSMAVSPDGQTLVSTSYEEGFVYFWNVENRQVDRSLRVGQGLITALGFSSNSETIGIGGYNGLLQLYQTAQGEGVLLDGSVGASQAFAFLPDERIATLSSAGGVVLLDAANPTGTPFAGVDSNPLCVTASRNNDIVAAGFSNGQIGVWSADDPDAPLQTLDSELDAIFAVALSSDGQFLAAAGPPDTPNIEVWNLVDGSIEHRFMGPVGGITGLSFQPGGVLLAATDLDGALFVWNTDDGSEAYTKRSDEEQRRFVAVNFSPDGSMIAVGSFGGDVTFLDARTGDQAGQIRIPDGGVVTMAFSPNGEQLAVSVRDEDVSVLLYQLPG